jgi:uncharacterized cupin superfamily protein
LLPGLDEAGTQEQVERWFKKALTFSSDKGWDRKAKSDAKRLYFAIVKAVHAMIAAANPEMNALWSAMEGKSAAGGEVTQGFALALLELIIAWPGALAQYLHRDLFSSEWKQCVLYGTPRRGATVKADFHLVRNGKVYQGDAGAVKYLTELHATQAATWTTKEDVQVPVLTAAEFARLVQGYASLVAMALTETTDDSSGVVKTPLLITPGGEPIRPGTVTYLSSEVVHGAPAVGSDENLSVQVIFLANKTGDDRGAAPTETRQAQSLTQVLEFGFVEEVLESQALMAQLKETFFLKLAAGGDIVLPKRVCDDLVRVGEMNRAAAGYAAARESAIADARKCIHKWHTALRSVEYDLTDEEDLPTEDAGALGPAAPLGRAWRAVGPGGLVAVRRTRATRLGRRAKSWTPRGAKHGGELMQNPKSWTDPQGEKIHFTGLGEKYRGQVDMLFSGRYSRELGLITKGECWLVVLTQGEADACVRLGPGTLVSIKHGARCRFIVKSATEKLYVYEDCEKAAVHIRGPNGKRADLALDAELQFDQHECDGCKTVAWEESFVRLEPAAKELCRKCWTLAGEQPKFVRHIFGKAAPEGGDKAKCGCSKCWPLPDEYSRAADDESDPESDVDATSKRPTAPAPKKQRATIEAKRPSPKGASGANATRKGPKSGKAAKVKSS